MLRNHRAVTGKAACVFRPLILSMLAACCGLLPCSLARQQEPAAKPGDEFLAGYVTSLLEFELGWPRSSFRVEVHEGVVTVTLPTEDPARRARALERLAEVQGITTSRVEVEAPAASASAPDANPPGGHSWFADELHLRGTGYAFPESEIFQPLLADPRELQFFGSILRFNSSSETFNAAVVGFGETFGLYRWEGSREGDGLQFGLGAGLIAVFDIDTPSRDLLNTDFIVGFPLTYRFQAHSARLRLFHQSSHLGDEFILRTKPDRIVKLSYEAVEFIYSRDWNHLRFYGGGQYMVFHKPSNLDPAALHAGIEYHGTTQLFGLGRPVGGLDLKSNQQSDWATDISLKFGIELGEPDRNRRHVRVLVEAFHGYSPIGQFYQDRLNAIGLGVYLGF